MKPYISFAAVASLLYFTIRAMVSIGWLPDKPSYALEVILYVVFITALIYRYILRFSAQGPETTTQFYLLSIALKLFAGCAFVTAIAVLDKAGARGNVVLFLVSYIIFTGLEVMFLKKALKS